MLKYIGDFDDSLLHTYKMLAYDIPHDTSNYYSFQDNIMTQCVYIFIDRKTRMVQFNARGLLDKLEMQEAINLASEILYDLIKDGLIIKEEK